ncbi:MAG TPA: BamA/TamA family outer membrane protein, partial [Chitinophagales bacterium]|nr:BamA/TamA family outer membrane protein [Chitinophagales bacterium]
EGLFGTAGSVSYENKNLSKGADRLIVDVSSGVQIRFTKPKSQTEKVQLMTATASAGITYYLNKFLVPFRAKLFSPNTNPKTRISISYNFEHRFDFDQNGSGDVVFLYQLHNFNASFGYEWSKNQSQHHLLNPLTIDFYLLPKTGQEFIDRLNSNSILKSSFEEQVIIGPNYSFAFTNQRGNDDRRYMNFHLNLETAGNIIEAGYKLASLHDQHDSLYLIANRPFSQYFRVEGEWVNKLKMSTHSLFAIRTYAGIGVPYGNSVALPFIKQFYVGGPNSLRGFMIREIGPGSYADTSVFDPESGPKKNAVGFFNQSGDLKLEANAEIRFDIYKWLKGALFVDAGNVWTLRADARTGGNFDINRFWKEFAVDAGAGLRLDFNYFVIRFDYGFPFRDPRRVDGERWQFNNWQAFKIGQLQLAIGYPF